MANLPLVSIIIPTYNAASTLPATVQSALIQKDDSFKLEIIVVNDGSTDQSQVILDNYCKECTIITTKNRGVSAARTTGLEHAKGDYIQYLDSDDLLQPGKIKQQLNALIDSDADIAYGDWQKFTTINGEISIIEIIQKQITGIPEIAAFTDFWCPPATLLYSTRLVKQLKWNDNLPIIQDARYLFDAVRHSGKIIYTPGLQALYRTQQANSLSQRTNAFMVDCYTNAIEVYEIWKHDPENARQKKQAIIDSLRFCIHEFSIHNKEYFNKAINFLLQIEPGYIPEKSFFLHIASLIFGYRTAEKIASFKRLYL
ncbi:glycosyltransferase family 2 protein [Mucilaginibacter sp. L196]|uniref:glycosyltransferase family 2 protein n=1 Tax=Mucilaginibacter sp. L196 TaxID=1641870 RepID=UPI00131EC015|nr:glycosyltransferase family 2 protein [Mucilaginibacter sp. L196]